MDQAKKAAEALMALVPKSMEKEAACAKLKLLWSHVDQILAIVAKCNQIFQVGSKASVQEEDLLVVAQLQSEVFSLVKGADLALPDYLAKQLSKWAVLNPVRDQAVALYDCSIAEYKLAVVEMVPTDAKQFA